MADIYIDQDLTSPSGDGSALNPYGWDEWIALIPTWEAVPNTINIKGSHQYSQNIIGTLNGSVIWDSGWYPNIWRINCTGYTFSLTGCWVRDGILLADTIEIDHAASVYMRPINILRLGYGGGTFQDSCSIILATGVTLVGQDAIVFDNTVLSSVDANALVAAPKPPYSTSNYRTSYTNKASLADLVDPTVPGDPWDTGNWMDEGSTTYNETLTTPSSWMSTYLGEFRLGMTAGIGPWWAEGPGLSRGFQRCSCDSYRNCSCLDGSAFSKNIMFPQYYFNYL